MKKEEKLVIIENMEKITELLFPISISPLSQQIIRTRENENKYRHVTSLIIPIVKEGNEYKILVIDKSEKIRLKNPGIYRQGIEYLDIIGGHFTSEQIPIGELQFGKLTDKTALRQATRELFEELKLRDRTNTSFVKEDLVFLDFCMYQSDSNKELSLVYGLVLGYPAEYYEAYDDMVLNGKKKNIRLTPPKSYSYNELATMWEERDSNKDRYEIQDGLGRLLDKGNLPEMISKMEFPVRNTVKIDLVSLSTEVKPVTGSLKAFDIDLPITDLLRGYSKISNRLICSGCELELVATNENEYKMRKHWEQYHNADKESRFINLINSSIADLSYIEKLVCYRIFLGMSNKEIAEDLNIQAVTTVNSIRQRFKSLYERSKIILMLSEMLPPFKKNRKTVREELIPALDQVTGRIINFYTKEQLHSYNPEMAPLHPTVIILVVRKDEQNNWTLLVKDKANMVASLTGELVKSNFSIRLDFCGGHVEIIDIVLSIGTKIGDNIKRNIGKELNHKAYLNTARRELVEEVSLRGGSAIDPDNLIEFCDITYNGPTLLGWNNEISKIYIYQIPSEIPTGQVRTWDMWEDPLTGKKVKKEYVCEFKTLPELMSIYDENADNYMDGAMRVLEKMKSEPTLEKHLFNLLDKMGEK